jgi:phosphopantothenoylcysteine decarboxylase/phosphopantothenate--cysteine ligase
MAAMATGLAGDPITAACLATTAPVVVAPAMDGEMYAHPATRANVARLRDEFRYRIVEPAAGPLASGQVGQGRLAETAEIVDAVVAAVAGQPIRSPDAATRPPLVESARAADLDGCHLVISAGGTAEPIDPVRFIGNRSSGKMGVAIAAEARSRGADVVLILGPGTVPPPPGVRAVHVSTAEQMRDAVLGAYPGADVVVMAAAVADFRPKHAAEGKLKKELGTPELVLEPTPDILRELGERRGDTLLVGFAAETSDLEAAGRKKLRSKGLDLVVVNQVGGEGTGFNSETNDAMILAADGRDEALRTWTKPELAGAICERIVGLLA